MIEIENEKLNRKTSKSEVVGRSHERPPVAIFDTHLEKVARLSYQDAKIPSKCQNVKITNDKAAKLELTQYMNSTKYKVDIKPTKLTSEFNWSLIWTYDKSQ